MNNDQVEIIVKLTYLGTEKDKEERLQLMLNRLADEAASWDHWNGESVTTEGFGK